MTDEKPDEIEDVSDGELEEVKKKPEYKDASTPEDLWKSWLERRKTGATTVGQGSGGIGLEGQHATGDDKSINKPVETKTYIGKPNSKGKEDEKQ
jgi:hypothetical protein|tara:strand:- start:565 stop:849 length:285 start_codon:yes stop_codon:yes gene_type:complete